MKVSRPVVSIRWRRNFSLQLRLFCSPTISPTAIERWPMVCRRLRVSFDFVDLRHRSTFFSVKEYLVTFNRPELLDRLVLKDESFDLENDIGKWKEVGSLSLDDRTVGNSTLFSSPFPNICLCPKCNEGWNPVDFFKDRFKRVEKIISKRMFSFKTRRNTIK